MESPVLAPAPKSVTISWAQGSIPHGAGAVSIDRRAQAVLPTVMASSIANDFRHHSEETSGRSSGRATLSATSIANLSDQIAPATLSSAIYLGSRRTKTAKCWTAERARRDCGSQSACKPHPNWLERLRPLAIFYPMFRCPRSIARVTPSPFETPMRSTDM